MSGDIERYPHELSPSSVAVLLNEATQATPESGNPSKVKRAVTLALSQGIELFHDPQRRPFARIRIRNHFENCPVENRMFKLWLSCLFWKVTGDALARESLNAAGDILAAVAVNESQVRQLHNRVAWHEGTLYYDLADDEWRAAKITKNGWEIVQNPPVFFERYTHQKAQAIPARGGDWRGLCEFLNLNEREQKLFTVVLVAYFLPDIARPLSLFIGEHGSAKSTTCTAARELIDPSLIPLFGAADMEELPQILAHHFCVPLDNIGRIGAALSDLLCRGVSGGGISKRKLYSDEEDVILTFKRAMMVNSISSVVGRPDLLDRAVIFHALPVADRKSEEAFWEQFNKAKPRVLGGLFDLLSEAMRLRPALKGGWLPRMADFAVWGAAIAEAMHWGAGEFRKAYQADALDRNQDAIEASVVAPCIIELLRKNRDWEGTAGELLQALKPVAAELGIKTDSREWPGQPNIVSRRVNELIPVLRMEGIQVSHGHRGKQKLIRLLPGKMGEISTVIDGPTVPVDNTTTYESSKTVDTVDTVDDFPTLRGEGVDTRNQAVEVGKPVASNPPTEAAKAQSWKEKL